jgi:hypothetical protein
VNEDGVSAAVIREILKNDDLHEGRNIIGMHLGCCSFLNRSAVEFLRGDDEEDIAPWWIAGFNKRVDWIEATALDFLFFNKLLDNDKNATANPVKTIRNVASGMMRECRGLARRLGFQIYLLEPDCAVEAILT